MPFGCNKRRALSGAVAAVLLLAACKGEAGAPRGGASTTRAAARGVVRVGVWQPFDPFASTYGGAAARALLYPQLFRATPAGGWEAAIVQPGSDRTAPGARSARFRLRRDAVWSDGTRITVRDLRRTMDPRFVAKVDAPTPQGDVVVHFTQRLPGWRRLWSGLEVIRPEADGVFGGPYRLGTITPGLETVFTANSTYFDPPKIREARFVLVPDSEVAARLLERGELDVIAPPAFTDRTRRLRRIKNASVTRGDAKRGGLTVALVANPARLSLPQRQAILGLTQRKRFVDVVLHDEAVYEGPAVTAAAPAGGPAVPSINAPVESPPVGLYLHAMQRAGRRSGVRFELRKAEFDQVLSAYAASDFDLLVRIQPTVPDRCWVCEAATVDPALASEADAGTGDAADRLERRLATEGLALPLWREVPVIAVRHGLEGVTPNGFSAAGPAWNITSWRWKDA